MSEVESVVFLKHIVGGFKELNKRNMIHRDIKPANIMLKEGIAKIADFGLSRIVMESNTPEYLSRVGSTLYMSP